MGGGVVWSRLLPACVGIVIAVAGGTSAAAAATLSGTVSGQAVNAPAQPISGAAVSVTDPGSGAVIGSGTTDGTGAYSVTVAPGVYDVHVAPAPAQMLVPTTVHDVDLVDDRRLDVVLVPAGAVRLSGVVRDAGGAPVVDVRVGLRSRDASTRTDAEGRYVLVASPRAVAAVVVEGPGWDVATQEFALMADAVRDIQLPPRRRVSVRVLGEDGEPLAGATVRMPELDGVSGQLGDFIGSVDTGATQGVTGADGLAVFDGFGGNPRELGTVVPAPGSGYALGRFEFETVSSDVTVDARPPRAVRLSGVVRDAVGDPIGDVRVGLQSRDASTRTDAEGRYALEASPRSAARVLIEGSGWDVSTEEIPLTVDQVRDFQLPPRSRVSVRVLGDDGTPLAGATVRMSELDGVRGQLGDFVGWVDTAPSSAVTGTDGVAVFDGFGGDPRAPGTVAPAPGSGYGTAQFTFDTVLGDVTVEVRPPRAVRLSGTLRDAGGAPVEGARVGLTSRNGGLSDTDAEGRYELNMSPRAVGHLAIESPGASGGLPSWELSTEEIPLMADAVRDVRLPALRQVSVRVLDEGGEPLEGATVRLPAMARALEQLGDLAGRVGTAAQSGVSDADGVVVFDSFGGSSGSATGTVVPPPGSDYLNARFPVPVVLSDTTVLVRFQSGADVLPPAFDCVQPPPAGWVSDEAVVRCSATDFPAGLANPADAEFELATVVGEEGEDPAALTASREVCDTSGNCATAGPFGPFQVDRKTPRIRFEQQPDGLQGWFVAPPGSATAIAEDAAIGSLDCSFGGVPGGPPVSGPGTLSVGFETTREGRHPIECTATDEVGHVATASGAILIDRTRPRRPTATTDRPPDYAGRGGWYRDEVTASFVDAGDPDLADGNPGSGADPSTSTQPQTVTTSGVHSVTGTIADVAGNRSLGRSLTVRVDADPPRSDLSCPGTVRRGLPGFARWTDRDSESGLAGLPVGLALLDSSTLGSHSFSHTAFDNVGHSTTVTCTYVVTPLFG